LSHSDPENSGLSLFKCRLFLACRADFLERETAQTGFKGHVFNHIMPVFFEPTAPRLTFPGVTPAIVQG
jgi:hypothetical protein